MTTSVVIPCWINDQETLDITAHCIQSFRISGDQQLVLVDNASLMAGGLLRSEADIYIRFRKNMGFVPAINAGIKVATGDMVCLANNDIRVPDNWEQVCRDIFASDSAIAFVHPKMIDYDEPFVFGDLVAPQGRERWCGNSLSVTTRSFMERLKTAETGKEAYPGLFDENFGVGGGADDWDFFHRIRKLGKQCYTNKTAFQHKMSHSLKKLGEERQKIVDQNNEYFFQKYGVTKEEMFAREFPEQVLLPYLPFP